MKFQESLKPAVLSLLVMASSAFIPVLAQNAPPANTGIAQPAGVEGGQQNWRGQHKHQKGQMFAQLGLSDQQKQQMKSMHQAFRQENAAAFESLKAKHQQYKQMMQNGQGQSPEAQALKAQMKEERKALWTKKGSLMKSVLTPEQLQKWEAMKQQRQAKWQHKAS